MSEFRLLILRGEGESPGSGQTPEGMCSFLPPLVMQETWVQSLGQEDPLEKGMVFLAGEFHGQRSLVGYSPRGHKESDTTE